MYHKVLMKTHSSGEKSNHWHALGTIAEPLTCRTTTKTTGTALRGWLVLFNNITLTTVDGTKKKKSKNNE